MKTRSSNNAPAPTTSSIDAILEDKTLITLALFAIFSLVPMLSFGLVSTIIQSTDDSTSRIFGYIIALAFVVGIAILLIFLRFRNTSVVPPMDLVDVPQHAMAKLKRV